jgi:tetrahedral aminopeptidase
MKKEDQRFLENLLAAPGPSGYEGPVRKVWAEAAKGFADQVRTDVHGNCIAVHNPQGDPAVMLAGHMDELGFLIIHIDDNGYLYFDTIGGFDLAIVPGRKVRIQTRKGSVLGVLGKKPIHLMAAAERGKVLPKHELWIDIGVENGEEARKLVEIGDSATYDANFEVLRGDLVVSRGLDNKMGAYIAAQTVRRVARSKRQCKAALYGVATVQEEIGTRGAITSTFGIGPLVGIALDVTWAMDHPGVDKRKVGDVRLGGGPVITRGANVNPVVFERLVAAAKKKKIPYQVQAEPGATGTDARSIQLSGSGVATGLVSVAQRYMHTPVEVLSLRDLDHTVALLSEFVLGLDSKVDFTPR